MTRKIILTLLLITLLGVIIRFYNLDKIPIALTGDEAAFGYNAYSILQTASDEHGNFLPLAFKSFGDYKPPFFVYLLVPFVAAFGLTEFAIRFPSALLGTLLIPVVYLVCKLLFKKESAALLSAFLIAISPWAINFSRGGFEANIAIFFIAIGVLLFLLSLKRQYLLYLSLFFLLLAMYTYHAQKIVTPLLMMIIGFLYYSSIKLSKKAVIISGILIFLLLLPLLIGLTNISGQSRARGTLVTEFLQHPVIEKTYQTDQLIFSESDNFLTNFLFHPTYLLGINDILSKVYAYFSPTQVFVYGDEVKRHGVEDFGVIYLFEFLFIVSGIIYLTKQKRTKEHYLVIGWLLVGLIPAILTRDKLHTIRSFSAVVPLYLFEGLGAIAFFQYVFTYFRSYFSHNRFLYQTIRLGLVLLMTTIIFLSFGRYLINYFLYSPIKRAADWQYGYKQMVLAVAKEQHRFDHIVIDSPKIYGNPYIFFLFYQQFDPISFNQTVKREDDLTNNVSPVYSFDKYQFREVFWPKDRGLKRTLFVGTSQSLPKQDVNETDKMKIIDEIKMPQKGDNGEDEVVFRIVEVY